MATKIEMHLLTCIERDLRVPMLGAVLGKLPAEEG